jgi:hypothetical protein
LGLRVEQRKSFVKQLLIAIKLLDAHGQFLDLLLLEASAVAGPVRLSSTVAARSRNSAKWSSAVRAEAEAARFSDSSWDSRASSSV